MLISSLLAEFQKYVKEKLQAEKEMQLNLQMKKEMDAVREKYAQLLKEEKHKISKYVEELKIVQSGRASE
jgi:transcriptional regulator of heat shock response